VAWSESFHFIRPWWLLCVLPAVWFAWQLYRRTQSTSQWDTVVDAALMQHILEGQQEVTRRPVWYVILGFTWVVCTVAMAGPSWERKDTPTYRDARERVIVIDLSRSMDAQDIQPSRLDRTRQKVADILARSADTETAVVIFAATPFVVAPLTNDVQTIRSMLPGLNTSIMPAQGSRTGPALLKAYELLEAVKSRSGSIVLFTDSSVNQDAIDIARQIAETGITLSVIGVGTPTGAPIARVRPERGFMKDANGDVVVARLDEAVLEELAAIGGGSYSAITTDDSDIKSVLRDGGLATTAQDANTGDGYIDSGADLQIEAWLDRGPYVALLLLPLAAFVFRRGWL